MFTHNIKDKLTVFVFFIIIDIIFYPWLNSIIMTNLTQILDTVNYTSPSFVFLNWPSVLNHNLSTQLFILFHIGTIILFIIYNPYRLVSFDLDYEDDGKPVALKTGEHGTARLATYDELKKRNQSYLPTKTTDPNNKYPLKNSGLILSSRILANKNKDVEVIYMNKDVHSIILGATGSGKSESFIKPTILTLADAGESMIIHDPKGELKRDYAGYLRDVKGYDVIEMNYSEPRMGDQFNQLENVERRLKVAQEHSIIAKACELIVKYLEIIITEGESIGELEDTTSRYKKIKMTNTHGPLAIRYLRDFFISSYGQAWNKIDQNFYTYYRREKITLEALRLLKDITPDDIIKYAERGIEEYDQYIKSITSDQSNLIHYGQARKKDMEAIRDNAIKNKQNDQLTISLLMRYFKELKEQHFHAYKDAEAEANIYARSIANMLVGTDSEHQKGEKIWEDTPRALIVSIILFVCRETHLSTSAHMGSVFRFLSELSETQRSGRPNETRLEMDTLFSAFTPDDPCRLSQTSARVAGDRTKSSIMVSAVSPLEIFSTPSVIEQGSRTSFDIKNISKKPTAVFVLSAGRDENPIFTVLTSLFIEQTYVSLIEQTKEDNSLRLPIRVNYLLDELGNMAPIPELGSKVSLARSRGIRFNFVLQSFTQLDTNYKSDKHTIMENTSWFYLLTQDYETAKQISDRCGSYTADAESQSLNKNSPSDITGGASKQKMARPLYTPDEIMRFKIGTGLAITSSDYPAKVNILPAYEYPQSKEVEMHKVEEMNIYRPKQIVNFFVPEPTTFVIAYKAYHDTTIFDELWQWFNTTSTDDSTESKEANNANTYPFLRSGNESNHNPDMYKDIMNKSSKPITYPDDLRKEQTKKAKEYKKLPKVSDTNLKENAIIQEIRENNYYTQILKYKLENPTNSSLEEEAIWNMLNKSVITSQTISENKSSIGLNINITPEDLKKDEA